MKNLSERSRRQLRAYEELSFRGFCHLHGLDEREYGEKLLKIGKDNVAAILGEIDPSEMKDQSIRGQIDAMRYAPDLYSLRETDNAGSIHLYAGLISNHFDRVSINSQYVESLYDALKLKAQASDREKVLYLLDAIPLISDWGMQFQAFVTGKTVFDGLPGICVYETLQASCGAFTLFLAPFFLEFEPTVKVAGHDKIAQIADDPAFVELLLKCLKFPLGEGAGVEIEQEVNTPAVSMVLSLIALGSVGFVWLHEFGHLLHGHLRVPESHHIEFEADRFALTLLAHESVTRPHGIYYYLGALTTLVVLDIMETVGGVRETTTHPRAKRRLGAALQILAEIDSESVHSAHQYVRALSLIVTPTLKRQWNVEIDYS